MTAIGEQHVPVSTRNELLDLVRAGQLAPDEADERATSLGLGPLSNSFHLDDYHPNGQSRWTLTMVLAWISWRTFAEVREWDARYLAQCRKWAPAVRRPGDPERLGYDLCCRRVPNAEQFAKHGHRRFGEWNALPDGRPAVLPTAEARHTKAGLWRALQDGQVTAEGIPPSGGPRIAIPAREWTDIDVRVGPDGHDIFYYRHEPNEVAYSDILWPRAELLERFPPHRKSHLDERGNVRSSPLLEDRSALEQLYVWIDAAELDGALGQVGVQRRKRRAHNKNDLTHLEQEMTRRLASNEPPLTVKQSEEWGKRRGLSRDAVRDLRRKLGDHLKLKRGEKSSPK
jgi:hypothetical protein